ncbi:hypothetical protein BGZ76_005531 [Entomortierella beljakovae]|nr:hypothetical protein BGZ76_005531 [Entomortierella beljakovae]
MCIGFAIGAEYFVLLPLQYHFPRHSHLFSPIEWILWGVPTKADLAIEMFTKQRERAQNTQNSKDETTEESNANGEETEHDTASISTTSSGLSPASRIKHEYQKRRLGKSSSTSSMLTEPIIDSTQHAHDKNVDNVEESESYSLAPKPLVNDLLDNFDTPPPLPQRQPSPRMSISQIEPWDDPLDDPVQHLTTSTLPAVIQPSTSLPSHLSMGGGAYPDQPISASLNPTPTSASNNSRRSTVTGSSALPEKTKEEVAFEFDRHVQEIRRRRTVAKKAPKPDMQNYTKIETESGKKVVDFPLYIKAV